MLPWCWQCWLLQIYTMYNTSRGWFMRSKGQWWTINILMRHTSYGLYVCFVSMHWSCSEANSEYCDVMNVFLDVPHTSILLRSAPMREDNHPLFAHEMIS